MKPITATTLCLLLCCQGIALAQLPKDNTKLLPKQTELPNSPQLAPPSEIPPGTPLPPPPSLDPNAQPQGQPSAPAPAAIKPPPSPKPVPGAPKIAPEPEPGEISTDRNPLNPAGDSMEKLIEMQFNDDLWGAMLGDMPCLEATESCIKQLQDLAVQKSPLLQELDTKIEEANGKIAEAQKNSKRAIRLELLSPALQNYLSFQVGPGYVPPQGGVPITKESPLEKIALIFTNPNRAINELLTLFGIPLVANWLGGSVQAQQRAIAIGDLQIKVAELQRSRAELAQQTKEKVLYAVLDFDQIRRNFQIYREIAKREITRNKILEVGYRFGQGDTSGYLSNLSTLDRQKVLAFQEWARLRTNLMKVKILVGTESN